MLDITVVVVNFNTRELTLQCLGSIRTNKSKANYEVIVIDNKSVDDSVVYIKKFTKENKKFKLISLKKNVGYAKANNLGIKKAGGKYIYLLNSDTKIKKDTLDKLINYAEKQKKLGVLGTKLRYPNGKIQKSCFNFPTIKNAIKEYWFGIGNSYKKYLPKTKKPLVVDSIVGASFLITPKALKQVGVLDEKYFMYFEDLDYCKRVRNAGLEVVFHPGIEVTHYHGGSSVKLDLREVYKMLHQSSKKYHGRIKHYIIQFILWSGQKWQKYLKVQN